MGSHNRNLDSFELPFAQEAAASCKRALQVDKCDPQWIAWRCVARRATLSKEGYVINGVPWGSPWPEFGMQLTTISPKVFLSPKVFNFNQIKGF